MVDQTSALHGYLSPEQFNSSDEFGITLEEITRFSLFQFAGWTDTMAQTAEAVIQSAVASTVPKIGQ